MTLAVDCVAYNAQRWPAGDALENADTGAVSTWAQIEDLVARTAGALVDSLGVVAGDRIALLADNDVRTFVLQFAAMRIRAVFVPLNWRLSPAELAVIGKDCAPRLLVHDAAYRSTAAGLVADLGCGVAEWGSADDGHFDDLVAAARPVADPAARLINDITHILYTSGTTGVPKGALVTGETLSWHTLNIAVTDAVTGPGDRLLCPLPLFHAGGLNTLANPVLISGGCVAVLTRFEPEQCLRLLGDPSRGFTHFGSVPTMYQMMTDLPGFADADFASIKHAQVAGGIATAALLETWSERGVELQVHYGGTEMGPAIAAMPRSAARLKVGSCGFPVAHTRVRLVTPDGREAGVGQVGEVCIQGRSVAPGYFENPASTQDAFVDGWFHTGDAARFDEDGFLYLVDRYKDMYKSGGENVFPAEVERLLLEHPAIAEVTVIAVPDDKWGEAGIAVVVGRGHDELTAESLAAFCGPRLARYKLPKDVVLVSSLPRNATGKVVKADIRAQYQAGELGRL